MPLITVLPESDHYLRDARRWAREHHDADGYIKVRKGEGGHFYRVIYGHAQGVSAIDAVPEDFPALPRRCPSCGRIIGGQP